MSKPKICIAKFSIILLCCLYFYSLTCAAQNGRLTLRGLSGSTTYVDLDALLPLVQGCDSLWYTDVQAKYNQENAWFAGLGTGYRFQQNTHIWGGNVFLDRAESTHHHYWIVSPGVETLMACWDVRLNGYIPVDKKRKNEASFFPSGVNECGISGDCSFVEFSGHQQFEHRFLRFEEVGPGVDLIAGVNLPGCGCPSVHAGVYYYHLDDVKDITGVGARIDLPINPNWAITGEASYDNEEHGAVAIGLRFQLGHTPKWGCCPALCDRLYDPVYRHIGPIDQATGVPVVRHQKDEGLFLRRDNIVFFSEDGTAVLGDANAGTFENPFADDQFTNALVTAVGQNINFYFNTGNYVINGGLPDNRVSLLAGQSIFGRSQNFRCTAQDDERPVLEGGIDIVGSSYNLDSIILENIQPGPATVIGLSITDASVHLCNDIIRAETTVAGDNTLTNAAIGIVANDSNVIIDTSLIEAIAFIGGDNGSFNTAIGIGNIGPDFTNNVFLIRETSINANASVNGMNFFLATNSASDIGNNIYTTDTGFTNNAFSIVDSALSSKAEIISDNMGNNLVTVIGNNEGGSGNVMFTDNVFSINCSSLSSFAKASDNAIAGNFATVIGNNEFAGSDTHVFVNNSFLITDSSLSSTALLDTFNTGSNFSVVIGNNDLLTDSSSFGGNIFSISGSSLNSEARTGSNDLGNFATVIGNNNNDGLIAVFVDNNFSISDSSLHSIAQIIGTNGFVNTATVIGNNAIGVGDTDFADNRFSIGSSSLDSIARIGDINTVVNSAIAIGNYAGGITIADFTGNIFSIDCTSLSSLADVRGDNTNGNFAKGIGTVAVLSEADFLNNVFDIKCTNIETSAIVRGDNTFINSAMGVDLSDAGNKMSIFNSGINVLALVEGDNTSGIPGSGNIAIGLSALGTNSVLQIFDSIVNVAAFANTEINTAVGQEGNVIASNTIFNIREIP